MLIEVFGDKTRAQQLANALGACVEFFENEKCARLYLDGLPYSKWRQATEKIVDLSYHYQVIIHDCGTDEDGPSSFLQVGAEWDAYYQVELENGCYRIIEESWGCDDEAPDGHKFPTYVHRKYRVRNGVRYDPPLLVENDDEDVCCNRESMMIYTCGDDLSATPDRHNVPRESAETPVVIRPETTLEIGDKHNVRTAR